MFASLQFSRCETNCVKLQIENAKISDYIDDMTNIQITRKANLIRVIAENGGTNSVAKLMGYSGAGFLSDMTRENAKRKITEETARNVETALHLPIGALDIPIDSATLPADDITALILLVGKKMGDTPVSANKFANLVALSMLDRREEHIDQLVSLLK